MNNTCAVEGCTHSKSKHIVTAVVEETGQSVDVLVCDTHFEAYKAMNRIKPGEFSIESTGRADTP